MTMTRVVLATILSNLAAPLLFVLFATGWSLWREMAGLAVINWNAFFSTLSLLLPILWLAMAIFVFPISLLAAIIGRAVGWRNLWIYAAFGCALGLSAYLLVLSLPRAKAGVEFALIYAAMGAICGWIYWRIASRSQTPHAKPSMEA